jgi:hypothetical protein
VSFEIDVDTREELSTRSTHCEGFRISGTVDRGFAVITLSRKNHFRAVHFDRQ